MRTLTMARILLAIGWLGAALLAASLGFRFELVPSGEVSFAHVVASFVALLLAVLAHCWISVFLVGCALAVRRTVREYSLDPLLVESGRRSRRWAVALALAAMALAAVIFLLRSGLGPFELAPAWHWPMAGLALAVQVVALVVEGRAVRRNEGVLDDVALRLSARSA